MQWAKSVVNGLSAEWHPSRWFTATTFWFPFVISIVTIVAAVLARPVFDFIIGEDLLAEDLQVVGWAVALYFCIRIARNADFPTSTRVLMAVLGAGIFFIIGEEISWGQRILDFQTPAELVEQNRQGESNLHNIYGVQDVFSWLMFLIGGYGVGASWFAMKRYGNYESWSPLTRTLAPHPILIPSFLLMFVWRSYRNFFEPPESLYYGVSEFGEITELALSSVFGLYTWRRWANPFAKSETPALAIEDVQSS
ncbi:MAG: hypothetical protein JJE47_02895 [Acidimicrobiia bacterium]|nr:hypothetical protein [Acidimicrobiia bacterium]